MRSVRGLMLVMAMGCGGEDGPSFEPPGGACGSVEVPDAPEPVGAECIVADTGCPAEPPADGSPCRGPLECPYGEEGYETYTCGASDRWEPQLEGAPPLGELCLDPFDGTLDGARVVLGPVGAGALTPFEDCAPLELVIGPQGGAMIPFRLQVDGVEDVPACLLVETRMSSGDATFDASGARVATHCGQSYLIYAVVPWDLQHYLCDAPDEVVLQLEVVVQGIGSAKARVRVDTPRDCNDEPDFG